MKITFPLMAITAQSRYIGLTWEPSETMTPIFDSPDRIYGSAAHVMALSGPAVGGLRFENALCGHSPLLLAANKPLKTAARILGGTGSAVTEAVKHYVRINGLPGVPEFAGGFERAVRMLAHGWLDSAAHRDGLWRHAVWGDNFPPVPAADAVMYMEWLAAHTQDQHLARKLQQAGIRGLEQIGDSRSFSSTISHAHVMSAPLLFGNIGSFVKQQSRIARDHLGTFSTDGIKLYCPGKVDYGRTHFADHANGISGRSMVAILEGAAFSGDRQLIDAALTMLDQVISVYAGTVPRGAQTWEVPLHTPDILASAHMVRACTLGYVLSGRQEYLQEARYWAWTGVPFVYLSRPAEGPVGTYATIAVLGATNWKAPVWFGRPVQWCGLVYAHALQMLARYDGKDPWEQIADGITATGLQMTWPLSDTERQGLLPDYFDLRAQVGLGPAINPGTVQAQLPQLYDRGTLYTVTRIPMNDWFVHAPCHIGGIHRTGQMVDIEIDGWTTRPYYVLVTGLEKKPTAMSLNVKATRDLPQHKHQPGTVEYDAEGRFVQFHLQGKARIQIVP